MQDRKVVRTNFDKELLNLSVEGIVDLGCCVRLDELCHVHILNENGHKVRLEGCNSVIRCDYLLFAQWDA